MLDYMDALVNFEQIKKWAIENGWIVTPDLHFEKDGQRKTISQMQQIMSTGGSNGTN